MLTVFLSVLVELFAHGDAPYAAMRAFYYGRESKAGGGLLGGMIASGLVEGFGLISAYVLTFVIMIVCLILITERSLLQQAGSRRRRKKRRYAIQMKTARQDWQGSGPIRNGGGCRSGR